MIVLEIFIGMSLRLEKKHKDMLMCMDFVSWEVEVNIMKSPRLNSNDGTLMCLDYMNDSIHKLERALEIIIENNKDGKQFDYCNCPELTNASDRLKIIIGEISKKVYQE